MMESVRNSSTSMEISLLLSNKEKEVSKRFSSTTSSQKVAGWLAFVFAFISVILVAHWMNGSNIEEGFQGGLNWDKLIFNWHPIMMVSGIIFCMMSAALSFCLLPVPKYISKMVHTLLHTGALICIIIGLCAVFIGNNNKDRNLYNTYYSNLSTIHSFLGLSAVILYFQNYIGGLIGFLLSLISEDMKKIYMSYHVYFGIMALMIGALAAETGIMELSVESGCGYSVSSPDINPAENYHKLQEGCRVANGAGLTILTAILLAFYALIFQDMVKKESENGKPRSKIDSV